MWISSPSNSSDNRVMAVLHNGSIENCGIDWNQRGFRPIVCLKTDVELREKIDASRKVYYMIAQ